MPLRVLAVIGSSVAGGAEENFAGILRGLDPRRFEVSVVCNGRGELYEEYARHARRIWTLDLGRVARPATVAALARVMREAGCDLVHTHLWSADTLAGLAARLARVPALVTTVTGAYHLPVGLKGLPKLLRLAKSRTFRLTYRLFDRVLACSQYVADDLRTRPGLKVPVQKIQVVPNAVDPERVHRAARAASPDVDTRWVQGSPVVATVANFHPIKGHATLVRAMPRIAARFPDVRFVLAGDGPTREEIERQVEAAGLAPRVAFAGRVPWGPALMAAADVVVVPSFSEGLPLTVLEALVLGRPVVASRAGGIPEALADGEAGWLVPAGDAAALAHAVVEAVTQAAEAHRRAARGVAIVRERFSTAVVVPRIERVYLELVNAGTSSRAQSSSC